MKKIKTAGDYTIYQKNLGRYAVQDADRKRAQRRRQGEDPSEAEFIKLSLNPDPPSRRPQQRRLRPRAKGAKRRLIRK